MRKTTLLPLAMFLAASSFAGCAAEEMAAPTDLEVAGSSAELRRDTDNDGHDDNDDWWYCGHNYGRDKKNRNKCPAVAAIAQPPAVKVGQSTRLKGFAVDIDGPRKLKYNWTASPADAGQIANPTSKRTSFKCVKPGKVHLTLSVSDGDCTRTAKVSVTCQPATQPSCGDGAKNGNELCDSSDPDAADKCPTSCNDNKVCTTDTLTGSSSTCNAQCTFTNVTMCTNGDGCCPSGCNKGNDNDCADVCGDGVKSGAEKCDSSDPDAADKCPTSCNDNNACTTDSLTGSGAACTADCSYTAITTCANGDGCCAPGCVTANDNDCVGPLPVCGDGAKNGTETCDDSDPDAADKCPASCNDSDACTADTTTGSATTCNVSCGHTTITTCTSGDGCCAAGCSNPVNGGTDSDCAPRPTCGDGEKSGTETCDNSDPDAADKCPTTCNDGQACTTDVLVGTPDECNVMCTTSSVTTCSLTADGCCPNPGCNANTDADCVSECGNGTIEPSGNETCDPVSSCPTSCPDTDNNACTKETLVGSPSACTSACTVSTITACTSGDGCCASGCKHPNDGGTDSDCTPEPASCGNGRKDGDETCDNSDPDAADKCPTSCNDNQACTADALTGSADACNVRCANSPITACTSGPVGDQCCPAGCNATNDGDCIAVCGNGVVESPELCDGATCPTPASCNDNDPCTDDIIEIDPTNPSPDACKARCVHRPANTPACLCGNGVTEGTETCDGASCDTIIADCNDGNPCTIDTITGTKAECNVVCTHAGAPTAECLCGNMRKDPTETCDDSSPNAADKCPTTCSAGPNACSPNTLQGSASTCSAECVATTITTCGPADGCCPAGGCATPSPSDVDCGPADPCANDPFPTCCACERAPRDSNNCRDSLNRCDSFPEAKFPNGAALCRAELDCIHRTKCAQFAPTDCLCGDGVDPFDCFTASSSATYTGLCKNEIMAAAGSQLPADLNTRFFDPDFPSGAADTVVETCDAFFCVAECLSP